MRRTDLTPTSRAIDWDSEYAPLLIFLPLVYVAWEDGCLDQSELEGLSAPLQSLSWLEEPLRAQLAPWLSRQAPPDPTSLANLGVRLAEHLRKASVDDGATLAEAGLAIARAAGGDGPWLSDDTRRVLEEMESQVGVAAGEALRRLRKRESAGVPVSAARPPRTGPRFDVAALSDHLNQPEPELRARVLELLQTPPFDFPLEMDRAAYRERVLAAVTRLADEGLGALAYPEEFGGQAAPGSAIATFETLAFGDLSVLIKFGVQFGLFGGSIAQLGTTKHHQTYLEAVGRLELPGGYGMTETGHGSNVRDIETTASYEADRDLFVLNTPSDSARKDYIGNAALHGRMLTVFAQLQVGGEEHGVHAFLVPVRDSMGATLPGIRIEDCGPKEGLNGIDNGRVWFDHVEVPRDNLLDRFATVTPEGDYRSPIPSADRRFFTMLGTLVAGRISIAAASGSATKTGLTIAMRYSDGRRQFGPSSGDERPLLNYLAHQRLLIPKLATTYALHFAMRDMIADYGRAARGETDAPDNRELEATAAGLKAYASRHCVETLQACREACGGQGYLAANQFARLKADTDVFATFEGANTVLLQLVAKGMLSEFREEMGDLRLWGMVRWLADRAQVRAVELNPVITRKTDEEHLRDEEFHLGALRYREDRLTTSAARRLKALIDDGVDSFEAMSRCQDHLISMAEAHVEHQILESFHEAVKRAPSPGLSEILRSQAHLYALHAIESDRAWYLEAGYIEATKSRAIRAQVNALCGELREHAVFLCDGFGIPDALLKAPIAVRTG